jgi:hypothetical protein
VQEAQEEIVGLWTSSLGGQEEEVQEAPALTTAATAAA